MLAAQVRPPPACRTAAVRGGELDKILHGKKKTYGCGTAQAGVAPAVFNSYLAMGSQMDLTKAAARAYGGHGTCRPPACCGGPAPVAGTLPHAACSLRLTRVAAGGTAPLSQAGHHEP